MEWQLQSMQWLLEAGVAGLLLLGLACFVVRYIRQPARQLLLIEWTFIACFTAPLLHLAPGLPSWSLGWLPSSRNTAVESVAGGLPGGGLRRVQAPARRHCGTPAPRFPKRMFHRGPELACTGRRRSSSSMPQAPRG